MTVLQINAFIAALAIIAAAALSRQRRWLRGRAATTGFVVAGVAVIAVLRVANLPPQWFDGGGWGFVIGAVFVISALLGRDREFRLPFFLGFGAALLALNVWPHVV